MGLMFLEAKIEKKEIYSMETIVQIILAPWTFFQWIFSIVVWYYVLRLLFSQAEGISWERFAVKNIPTPSVELDRRGLGCSEVAHILEVV